MSLPIKIRVITVYGDKHPTAADALQDCDASGWDCVLFVGDKYPCVMQEADRPEPEGVEFAYVCDHQMPDGSYRMVAVPVN